MSPISSLVKQIFETLREKELTIVTAESCTGGLLSALITDIPGISKYFERGYVTYSNEAKEENLGVPSWMLEQHGAVSEQVALSMANGALTNSHADIAVSITGVAGPDGGTEEKPVGLVFIACQRRSTAPACTKNNFSGNRDEVRTQSVQKALEMILEAAA
ncbi:MAG: nicotinamide-nucleotide amidohydrolase family protein [Alphaproteobacteria bacterium]|nr:nicotinamide-nucleotide amidohydrolase family protein [Alphaproteobacteria bacterium]